MESTTTLQVRIEVLSRFFQSFGVDLQCNDVTFCLLYSGAVLVFLPGLAEIKMLYEQLMSNRMFNNRGATRSVYDVVYACSNFSSCYHVPRV